MRIDLSRYVDPGRNGITMVPAVALSLLVFAYSTRFGSITILAFYALWLPAFCLRPQLLLRHSGLVVVLLLIPLVATVSMVWSQSPGSSLRAGIQYGTTIFCGLVAARLVTLPNLMLGGLAGGLLILMYSSMNGSYAYDVVDGSYAFVGAFNSKNQLGYFASLTIMFAVGVSFVYKTIWPLRLIGIAVAAYAAMLLWLSESATSVLTIVFAVGIVIIARILFGLAHPVRRVMILILIAVGIALAIAALQLGVFDAILSAFNKDTTLTGRTFLWNRGITIGGEQPVLGLGYYAFWVQNNPPAEELWEQFYITARTGFHFHNTLIEAYVSLGLVGLVMMGALSASLLVFSIRVMMNHHATGSAIMSAGLSLLFLVRSVVEIDFFTPCTAGSFLVPYLLLTMSDSRHAEKHIYRRRRRARNTPSAIAA